jgi:hypothetical protein
MYVTAPATIATENRIRIKITLDRLTFLVSFAPISSVYREEEVKPVELPVPDVPDCDPDVDDIKPEPDVDDAS